MLSPLPKTNINNFRPSQNKPITSTSHFLTYYYLFLFFILIVRAFIFQENGLKINSSQFNSTTNSLIKRSNSTTNCERTLLYEFAGLHGFASEFSLFLRLAVIAKLYKFSLIEDSSKWNYGLWTDYFQPLITSAFNCTLKDRRKTITWNQEFEEVEDPIWTEHNHVAWRVSNRNIGAVDDLISSLFVNQVELSILKSSQIDTNSTSTITTSETFPEIFRESFQAQAQALSEVWKFNDEIMIEDSNSSTEVSDSKSSVLKGGEISLGCHLRLGDKYLEVDSKKGPGLNSIVIDKVMEVAISAVEFLVKKSNLPLAKITNWEFHPNLIIMSDDPDAWKQFKSHQNTESFNITPISRTSETPSLKSEDEILALDPFDSIGGFKEGVFNQLSIVQRVELTKSFLRDLTRLSKVDFLIISAQSNVGRLLSLIYGEEKCFASLAASIDVRWFPTSKFI